MKNKKKLIIWGATGQSIVLEEFLSKDYSIEAIFDNNKGIKSPFKNVNIFYGKKGFEKWLKNKKGKFYFIVAIGGGLGKDRVKIVALLWILLYQFIYAVRLVSRVEFSDGDSIISEYFIYLNVVFVFIG